MLLEFFHKINLVKTFSTYVPLGTAWKGTREGVPFFMAQKTRKLCGGSLTFRGELDIIEIKRGRQKPRALRGDTYESRL